jgi:hypothetical protein
MSCDTAEFGVISQKDVTETLKHVFGAKTKMTGGIKYLEFNNAKLERVEKVYDLSVKVEILEGDEIRDDGDDGDDIDSPIGLEAYADEGENGQND